MTVISNATVVSDYASTIYSALIEDTLLRELRPAEFMRPFFRMGRVGDSLSFDFQLLNKVAATSVQNNFSETDTFASVEQSTTFRRVTSGLSGIMSVVGDIVKAVSSADVMAEVAGQLNRAFREQWETVACANLANYSNTTTAAASSLAYDDVLAAIAALEQRDVTAALVGGFHPKQLADVRADAATRVGSIFTRDSVPDLQGHYRDYWGSIAGVPLYASTVVSSSAGNYQGGILANGEANGLLEIWGPKIELWRDARALSTYVVLNAHYGMCEIDDQRGQTVLSSTT